ncbi:uncharacterized protein NEMAJ01_1260 [Nematocida major]|uniref:uncharacterized protein n=1 Tax=Nematocida major TaxID=1912982 RepID=UPI0020075921|nr:uncharacterized protein NEMAJ01_1260 [Nematocida major]KAH9386364.1 hypothetical protein NEMAJ01_1260 [Nematocida major]
MNFDRKKDLAEEQPALKKLLKSGRKPAKSSLASMQEVCVDSPVFNQMKAEIRRLYGEKVNMVNTNYIVKPHEFKCLAKSLSKAIWNNEKPLETVDDIIYAVDLLCSKQAGTAQGLPDESVRKEELATSIRFVASELRALVPTEGSAAASPRASSLSSDLGFLAEAKELIKKGLEKSGHPSIESLSAERDRSKAVVSSIMQAFSISPSDDLLGALKNMRAQEERRHRDHVSMKEKSIECQKRHFEELLQKANEKIMRLEERNREVERQLSEKKDKDAEVLERGDALEQNILQIKQVLAEEEDRIQKERQEYREVKKTLIEYNKKMAKIVQELVEKIKKEQRERDYLISLQEDAQKVDGQ